MAFAGVLWLASVSVSAFAAPAAVRAELNVPYTFMAQDAASRARRSLDVFVPTDPSNHRW